MVSRNKVWRAQGDFLCAALTGKLKGLGQCNTSAEPGHPGPSSTEHGSLQGQRLGVIHHLSSLSRLSMDSKANN